MIVVDTSAMVTALRFFGSSGDKIREILSQLKDLAAPSHQAVEIIQAFRSLDRGGTLAADTAHQAIEDYIRLGVRLVDPDIKLVSRVWELRHNLTAYDALFVALAERLDCEFLTGDAKIARSGVARCPVITVETDF
ncbi:type II toxin-antitoxin system VapC family toxin [Glycomyces albidus]|uniref:Ribonuclease VapC n=1 Tax=Glycomyces albidus TaxID=2656774 RepID=A0A6L5GDI5_9ACTN|nr:type II toxin-antitoxin system VapC family toxin [Glycomyces albidus]MQM27708.1 PIN domain-containing protein [Glycomyces albidus]